MAVQLRSLTGKVDPVVELTIRDLVLAVNQIQTDLAGQSTAFLSTRIDALTAASASLLQRLERLELRVKALEDAP